MNDRDSFELSDEQQAARDCDERFVVILASAGSGKTEVVAQRVERILTNSHGFRILALSYTRRAAAELRSRFAARVGEQYRRVETDTLHGFAQGLLLQYGTWIGIPSEPTIIVDDADRVELLQEWRASVGKPPLSDPKGDLTRLDVARARCEDDPIADDWDAALTDVGGMDYEAMLARAKELLEVPAIAGLVSRLFKHLIVDEAQNLTASQYELLKALIHAGHDESHVMLVGDDKQSIVGFAGASPEYLHRFENDFGAKALRLSQNFRSAAAIVALGDRIASALGDPPSSPQTYAAHGAVESAEFPNESAEADAVTAWVDKLLTDGLSRSALAPNEDMYLLPSEIAILGRTAASLRACEQALARTGHPVAVSTHADDWLGSEAARFAWLLATFRPDSVVSRRRLSRELSVDASSREEIRNSLRAQDALQLLNFADEISPQEFVTRVQEIDHMDDEFWPRDRAEIVSVWSKFCDLVGQSDRSWSQFELFVARWQRGEETSVGIRLLTVHKSQGREFKAVAVVGLNDGQFPDRRSLSGEKLESELRAFYVAVTRPSRALLLTRPKTIETRNGPWTRPVSRFLQFLRDDIDYTT